MIEVFVVDQVIFNTSSKTLDSSRGGLRKWKQQTRSLKLVKNYLLVQRVITIVFLGSQLLSEQQKQ
jgi:hypothetical protein